MWLMWVIEHIPITIAINSFPGKTWKDIVPEATGMWLALWWYYAALPLYFVNPARRPAQWRSRCALQVAAGLQVLNLGVCFYWSIVDWATTKLTLEQWGGDTGMLVLHQIGIIITWTSLAMVIKLMSVERQLYRLWGAGAGSAAEKQQPQVAAAGAEP